MIICSFSIKLESMYYRKVLKLSDARKFCFNLSKVQIKRSFDRKNCAKSADRFLNSVDPDQTAPLGAV